MIGSSDHRPAITETPKAAFRHLSEMKSQVILKLFGSTCDAIVTKVKQVEVRRSRFFGGTQTRRYRLVVTRVGMTASTTPTTTTPSMAKMACSQPIQATKRTESRTPRMIQK